MEQLKKVWSMSDESEEVLTYAADLLDNVPDKEETKEFISQVKQCACVMTQLLDGVTCDGHS
ncbi:MAG TPA: hypothetical protein PLY41_02915 [Acetomicrobium sp.]|nr:hypothetical protein [Acetomicrobium sp.]